MPLLSLVLAEAGDANAEELLGPELPDVEVLVIGDAPAPTDARVRVLPAPAGGLHATRNLALDEARGDHLWFLDGRLEPGALAGVGERLRSASPDLVLAAGGRHKRLLDRVARDGVTTLERRPALADAAPGLGDKVLRRDLLRELGVRFGPEPGGELAVTWPALLSAERIAAAPAARFQRAREAPPSPDVFANYETVFAFVTAHRELPDERRRLVLGAMLRRELAALDRLHGAERRDHFDALSDAWRRHRRGDEPIRGGRAAQLEARLVERSDRRALAALREAQRGRRALSRRRAGVTRRVRKAGRDRRTHKLERRYRAALREPIDPDLAVFAAYWYRGYSCNPRAIYERARELVPGMRGVWVVKPGGTVPDGVEHVAPGTPEYYDVLARARVFVNNVNFPNHLVKREDTVHVMTHHGTPLKLMGLDLQKTPVAGKRMDFDALRRRSARWDYSVSSNQFSTEIWERVFPAGYESLDVGYPRNDVLADPDPATAQRVRAELGIEPGQVAVLYAPTHREYQSSYVPVLDAGAVAEALGPDHVVLARTHYFYGSDPHLRELHRQGRVRDVAAHPSVEELCLAADALVTDYSSIMFDYAVLDRPIVIHAPDWETYRALRGTYFDLMAEPPGLVTRTQDELVAGFQSGTVWGAAAARSRADFRARFCAWDDGRAAERVVRRVWLGEREPAPQGTSAVTQ